MSDPIVTLTGVRKVFDTGAGTHVALDGIDLSVERGEIFAVIGHSGAGKSTLVRLLNGLETATEGQVVVDGVDITRLRGKPLRAVRSRIGMVFQQFNLLSSRTVFGNVAYPLHLAGWSKADQETRVAQLLDFVGLLDKAWSYPEQLSGGQKQRIGIARALAAGPQLLLADESTSALDPRTTADVLALLRRVNEELGVTIVVITHEMDVVRAIADRVAVLDAGRVDRLGTVVDVLGAQSLDAPAGPVAARADGTLVRVVAADSATLGAALSRVARDAGVDFEIVDGGVERTKTAALSSFTLALHGPDRAVADAIASLERDTRLERIPA